MAWVFDASVTMAWCFQDERNPECDALFQRLGGDSGTVPQLWHLEVANILLQAMRQKKQRITAEGVATFLQLMKDAPIQTDSQTFANAWTLTFNLAKKHGLSEYDASYLELALRLQCELATLDRELRVAARAEGLTVLP